MGYNGGINKRGYYRRNNGMYKKSSSKFGEKLIGNIIGSGLSLLFSPSDLNLETTQINQETPRKINIRRFKIKKIICCIITVLCPICTILTYELAEWWMFFSVLLWGIIELSFILYLTIEEDIKTKYIINAQELDLVTQTIKQTKNIIKYSLIITLILDTAPFILVLLDIIGYYYMYNDFTNITTILIILKMVMVCISIPGFHEKYEKLNNALRKCVKKSAQNKNNYDL